MLVDVIKSFVILDLWIIKVIPMPCHIFLRIAGMLSYAIAIASVPCTAPRFRGGLHRHLIMQGHVICFYLALHQLLCIPMAVVL